ncbi:DUF6266 family protein [Algoriphagus zhangzhouensis]|uniref:Uncharacterized protein n=1 Tax=Algoriphagus zhangzhouensis TaxID=1073327 RepID=A0A1M7Z3N1_9BACT|nr:DUF6266 family protein [Algoriphagus zhangzhouensis]TDY48378.1 hypothetical protein A8938_0061 [Algoriphagus zhangzhouensis]SHO59425.1 hypothetical protein SAMN04488108_0061 [Algoriphagus zhangzhouensis]
MAKLSENSLIQPQGKVGRFTFYKLNGKTIMRSLPDGPHKNKTHPSKLQKVYQNRLKEVNAFLRPLKQILDFGYQNFLDQKTGVNWAHSPLATKGYNHNANPRINPEFLQISKGNLLGPENPSVQISVQGILISWLNNCYDGNASEFDECYILLNHPETKKYLWKEKVARRRDLQCLISTSEFDSELSWDLYFLFHREMSQKRCLISDSVYLGKV